MTPVRRTECEVAVVGLGPAGAFALDALARAGRSVVGLDRLPVVDEPTMCAEGIGHEEMSVLVDPRPEWIATRLDRGFVVFPNGERLDLERPLAGYILHRSRMLADVAREAAERGAVVKLGARVTSMARSNGAGGLLLGVEGPDGPEEILAQAVVGADGVQGVVGRWAGITRQMPLRQVYSCAQDLVEGVEVDPGAVGFWIGRTVAPGGYAWIFPKTASVANVGLGVVPGPDVAPAVDLLDAFRERVAPGGRVVRRVVGGVPLDHRRDRLVADRVILAGDAARLTDPLSGGGIANAMHSGRVAGELLAEALADGDLSAARLSGYEARYRKKHPETTFHYVLGKVLSGAEDEDMNRLVPLLRAMFPDGDARNFDAVRVGARFLKETPLLLGVAARLGKGLLTARRRTRRWEAEIAAEG